MRRKCCHGSRSWSIRTVCLDKNYQPRRAKGWRCPKCKTIHGAYADAWRCCNWGTVETDRYIHEDDCRKHPGKVDEIREVNQ